jgi:hypothetical protein
MPLRTLRAAMLLIGTRTSASRIEVSLSCGVGLFTLGRALVWGSAVVVCACACACACGVSMRR